MTRLEFQFNRLQKSVEKIRQEHPRASEPMQSAPQDDLTALIERIVKASPSEYPAIAKEMTRRDATLLVHAYQRRLSDDQHDAITEVLVLRPLPRQLTQGWYIFRNHPGLKALAAGLRRIAEQIPESQVASDPTLGRLRRIWTSERLGRGLILVITETEYSVHDWCAKAWPADLAVELESPLHNRLKGLALAHGSTGLLRRHHNAELLNWFSYVPEPLFDDAAANYIQQLSESEWDKTILEKCVNRHGLPAAGGAFWARIDNEKRMAIQRLIAGQLIAEFFRDVDDPAGRFRFWRDYVDHLVSIAYPTNRERVLLHFRNLIVVEFRDIGNAGYVYEEKHRAEIEKIVKSLRPHSDCKVPEIAVHRIIHNRNWQWNTRNALSRVLD